MGGRAHVPDLTSAKLRLTYLRLHEKATVNGPALHLGYTGRRGCRLSLWITLTPTMPDAEPRAFEEPAIIAYHWRTNGIGYGLLATGMDKRRFRLIADSVFESSRRQRGFDDRTRYALRQASDVAPPCGA
jgi:hypothetical protein